VTATRATVTSGTATDPCTIHQRTSDASGARAGTGSSWSTRGVPPRPALGAVQNGSSTRDASDRARDWRRVRAVPE
jgi:hypothetical protein